MLQEAIDLLSLGKDLSGTQMELAMEELMAGSAAAGQTEDFLSALSAKGESIEELSAAVRVMRKHLVPVNSRHQIIFDACGTGGDNKGTFNVSTAVAFVVAACGVAVAKHGNRAASSSCGSADILEALGVNIIFSPQKAGACLDEAGVTFLYAPDFHPAMKHVMPARRKLGKRTIFNLLGPLINPAGATHQLVGVFDRKWLMPMAEVLKNSANLHAILVHGNDGMDEVTTTDKSFICEQKRGKIINYELFPEDFFSARVSLSALRGGSAAENAGIFLDILHGRQGPYRDIVVLNSAAGLYAADKAASIKEGMAMAAEALSSGRAMEKFQAFKRYSNQG